MASGYIRVWACILAFVILLSGFPICAIASDPEPSSSSVPAEPTVPATSPTDILPPEESLPETSVPGESLP